MSEELIQKNLVEAPEKMGDWNFYNIGATTLKALKGAKIIPDRDYDEYETKSRMRLLSKSRWLLPQLNIRFLHSCAQTSKLKKLLNRSLEPLRFYRQKYILLLTARKVSGSIPQMVMRFCRKTAVKSRLILIRTVQSVLF